MSLSRRLGSISSGQKRRRRTEEDQYGEREREALYIAFKRLSLPLAVLILNPQSIGWRGRRAFLLRLAELHNPDAGVEVIEKDVIAELPGAPGEGQVRTEALRVAGP